jgi:hypothetical protein
MKLIPSKGNTGVEGGGREGECSEERGGNRVNS